ncbi:MAG TPA: carboxylesterase family protein [Streptosporangiaceae bacterium]|jgi:para-nitrobenzyl esterase|nr:carboxylesterase family protein [Streptosporangiaceae bacterium]
MEPVVATRYGSVRGQLKDGIASFLGIPYAASPTGERRFAAPAPPESWTGVRDATAYGPTPPKPDYPAPFDTVLPEPRVPGDDWLNLNVWTPQAALDQAADGPASAPGLPVIVWIHGGAFANGNSAVPMYDGTTFARDGVVFVVINYRLGVEGFAFLPDAPPNRGLLDQVAALEWVRDNISAFGGDPANVTIAGESAGAMSVITLMAMPRAAGLFAKVIAESGAVQAAADPADAALVTAELGAALKDDLSEAGVSAAALAELSPEEVIAAQVVVRDALAAEPNPARFGQSVVVSSMAFIPVVDGDVLPQHPLAAIASGAGADVPLLIGTNAEEFRFFLVPPGTIDTITDDLLGLVAGAFGATDEVIAAYAVNRPDAKAGDLFAAMLTDRFFRLPAIAVADARSGGTETPAATYFYEFAWGVPPIGAGHAVEIPFVFDNLSSPDAVAIVGAHDGPHPAQDVADDMHAAWVSFARTSDPGWPAFDASRPVRVFDSGGGSVELDPRGDERAIWPAG